MDFNNGRSNVSPQQWLQDDGSWKTWTDDDWHKWRQPQSLTTGSTSASSALGQWTPAAVNAQPPAEIAADGQDLDSDANIRDHCIATAALLQSFPRHRASQQTVRATEDLMSQLQQWMPLAFVVPAQQTGILRRYCACADLPEVPNTVRCDKSAVVEFDIAAVRATTFKSMGKVKHIPRNLIQWFIYVECGSGTGCEAFTVVQHDSCLDAIGWARYNKKLHCSGCTQKVQRSLQCH